jgi:hypothetical protein
MAKKAKGLYAKVAHEPVFHKTYGSIHIPCIDEHIINVKSIFILSLTILSHILY